METNKLGEQRARMIPNSTRWLAILAGSVSGLAGFLTIGLPLLLVPVLLILGAIIHPSAPRLGRWFLAIGAMLVSVCAAIFFVPSAIDGISSLPTYHDLRAVAIVLAFLVSIVLVAWTDIALAKGGRAGKA